MFNESTRAKYAAGTKVTGTAYRHGAAIPGVSTGKIISVWDEVIVRWDNPDADESHIRNLNVLTIVPPTEAELKTMATALSWAQAEVLHAIKLGDFVKSEPLGMRSSIRYTSKYKKTAHSTTAVSAVNRFFITDWKKSTQCSWEYKLTDLGEVLYAAFMNKYGAKLLARIESSNQ